MRSVRVAGVRLHQIAEDRFGCTYEGRSGSLVIRAQRDAGPRHERCWTVVARDWVPDGWGAVFGGRVRFSAQSKRLYSAARQMRSVLSASAKGLAVAS